MEKSISLHQACAPFLLYLATFRRNSATSTVSIQQLQTALKRELEKVKSQATEDPRLGPLFERAFYPLVATADQVVLGSAWTQRMGWSMNLLETQYFGRAEGGKEFYRHVDQVLSDRSEGAAELAELLFACMALGFQGELLGERTELERRRQQLFEKARLAGAMGKVLTPDAYGRNTTKDVAVLPTTGIIRLVGVTVGALVFALLAGRVATTSLTQKDRDEVAQIVQTLDGPIGSAKAGTTQQGGTTPAGDQR
jgi:type IV/VI secretion system ImpK/VasF family protein